MCGLVEHRAQQGVTAFGHPAVIVDLAGLVALRRQADMRADRPGMDKALRLVDRRTVTSHCDSGPASIPIRPKVVPSELRRAIMSPGSELSAPRSPGRLRRQCTPTFASPTHQDQQNAPSHRSFPDARGRNDLDPLIITEGNA